MTFFANSQRFNPRAACCWAVLCVAIRYQTASPPCSLCNMPISADRNSKSCASASITRPLEPPTATRQRTPLALRVHARASRGPCGPCISKPGVMHGERLAYPHIGVWRLLQGQGEAVVPSPQRRHTVQLQIRLQSSLSPRRPMPTRSARFISWSIPRMHSVQPTAATCTLK